MHYRQLGNSDLKISEIAYGSWLTSYGDGGFERAKACVDRALELGINFIDTANLYGLGGSETALGEILAGRPRDSYILGTKVYFPMSEEDRGLSRQQIEKQLDASLKRLRTDYVDLYQCHRYDEDTPLEETMEALTAAVRSGKVRYIGFSEWTPEQISAAFALPDVERFVSSQPHYSLLSRTPEKAVIPLCRTLGVSQIVFSPLAQGLLSGKYRPGNPPPADSRAASPDMGKFMGHWLSEPVLEAVADLLPIAEEAGCTLAQFALAWILREPNVAAAIMGASRPEQVDQNVGASGLTIAPELFARAEAIVRRVEFDREELKREEAARFRRKG
jgi:aryl-alcohol dehydrogenase-like predicted oxidoreductase